MKQTRLLFLLSLYLTLFSYQNICGQTATPNTSTTENFCENGDYQVLSSDIIINEGMADKFKQSETYTIIIEMTDSDFTLEPSVGTITDDVSPSDITITSTMIEASKITIIFDTDASEDEIDQLRITGLKVKYTGTGANNDANHLKITTIEEGGTTLTNSDLSLVDAEMFQLDGIVAPSQPTTSATLEYCAGFTGSIMGGNANRWYSDAGLTTLIHSGTNPTLAQLSVSSTTTIYAVRENGSGCLGPSKTIDITINPVPSLPTTPATLAYCADFTSSINGGNANRWYSDAGLTTLIHSGTDPTLTQLSISSTTTIYAAIENTSACLGSGKTINITINPVPSVSITTFQNFCVGDFDGSTMLSGPTVATGDVIKWYDSFPLGTEITTNVNPTISSFSGISTTVAGDYTLYVTKTNTAGCVSEPAVITVNVENATAFLSTPLGNNPTVCGIEEISLQITGTPGATYRIKKDGSNLSTISSGTISSIGFIQLNNLEGQTIFGTSSASSPHQITVEVETANGCLETSSSIALVVAPGPTVIFDLSPNLKSFSLNSGLFNLSDLDINPSVLSPAISGTGLGSGGVFLGNGIIFDGFNYFFDPADAGVDPSLDAEDHTITYEYTDIDGCTNTATQVFTVARNTPLIVENETYIPCDGYANPELKINEDYWKAVSSLTWLDATPVGDVNNTLDDWWISQITDVTDPSMPVVLYDIPGEDSDTNPYPSMPNPVSDQVPTGGIIKKISDRIQTGSGCVGVQEPRYSLDLTEVPQPYPRTLKVALHARFKDCATSNTYDGFAVETIVVNPSPTAVFEVPNEVCEGEADFTPNNIVLNGVAIDASSLGGVTFQYIRNDAPPSTVPTDMINAIFPLSNVTEITPGDYTIFMTTPQNIFNCDRTVTRSITVKPAPINADFVFNSNQCLGDILTFDAINLPSDITGWEFEWTFGDGFANVSTGLGTINHIYATLPPDPTPPATGDPVYDVTLKITNTQGCEKIISKPIRILPLPTANFDVLGSCLGSPTVFTDLSIVEQGGDNIVKWFWDFEGDGIVDVSIETGNSGDVSYTYPAIGVYNPTLTVVTEGDATGPNEATCRDIFTREFIVYPSVAPSTDDRYYEDFDASDGGWNHYSAENTTEDSWEHGLSSIPGSRGDVWTTNLGGNYADSETSYLETPCVDLSAIDNPVMLFRYWHEFSENDVLDVEVTYDDGETWTTLGQYQEGINWYNKVTNRWEENSDTWKRAHFNLDQVQATSGGTSVRFRFAFTSNPAVSSQGFALDEFLIISRNRNVLLEHFTNTNSPNINTTLDNINNFTDEEIIKVKYHHLITSEGVINPDVINQDNPNDPSARGLHYGVEQSPRTFLDSQGTVEDFTDGNDIYQRRILELSPFQIEVTFPDSGSDSLRIETKLTALDTLSRDVLIHVLIIEKEITGVVSEVPTLQNVVKKMLPDATGIYVDRTWEIGDEEEFAHSILLYSGEVNNLLATTVYDPSQVAVVVFVEDYNSKEIYQAGIFEPSETPNTVTSLSDELKEKLWIYPNPANKQVYVGFEKTVEQNYDWVLRNTLGQKITSGILEYNHNGFYINTQSLAEGVYFIELGNDRNTVTKKLLIKH